MHRTQISLEREQYELLAAEAQRRGVSLAAVVREPIGRNHNRFLYGRQTRLKRVFVDTSAWYALVDREDPDHAAVAQWLFRIMRRDGRGAWEICTRFRSFAAMERFRLKAAVAIDEDFRAFGLECLP